MTAAQPAIMTGAVATTGSAAHSVEVLIAKKIDKSICEESSLVENLWLVDGTGSYKGYISTAKKEFIKNWEYLKEQNSGFKLKILYKIFSDCNILN